MPLQVTPLHLLRFAALVGALDGELEDEPAYGNVRLELADDSHVAKWTAPSVLDALLAE